jgi:hypothetical protein
MAKTQKQLQKIVLENGFLDAVPSGDFTELQAKDIGDFLLERANVFKEAWEQILDEKNIAASGDITTNLDFKIIEDDNQVQLNISFVEYATYIDKGVKGKDYSYNAPDSPYQFKNYKMSKEGRASIKKWLLSGKAKVRSKDVQKYGAVRTEKKFKKISDEDARLNRVIYNIKKFGIKKRNFINPVLEKTLEGFEQDLADRIGKTVIINIFE